MLSAGRLASPWGEMPISLESVTHLSPGTQWLLRELLWQQGGHGLSLGASCQRCRGPAPVDLGQFKGETESAS